MIFPNEYNKLTTCVCNSNSNNNNYNDYKCQVFNSRDLMCKIFHYLYYSFEFDGDLFECSLVNSHWLYHAWDINCILC